MQRQAPPPKKKGVMIPEQGCPPGVWEPMDAAGDAHPLLLAAADAAGGAGVAGCSSREGLKEGAQSGGGFRV